jgi:hypothetical protein
VICIRVDSFTYVTRLSKIHSSLPQSEQDLHDHHSLPNDPAVIQMMKNLLLDNEETSTPVLPLQPEGLSCISEEKDSMSEDVDLSATNTSKDSASVNKTCDKFAVGGHTEAGPQEHKISDTLFDTTGRTRTSESVVKSLDKGANESHCQELTLSHHQDEKIPSPHHSTKTQALSRTEHLVLSIPCKQPSSVNDDDLSLYSGSSESSQSSVSSQTSESSTSSSSSSSSSLSSSLYSSSTFS